MLLLAGTLVLLLRNDGSSIAIPFMFAIILILVVEFLFLLDFYYIRQTDLFRILYNQVRVQSEDEIDFSMEVDQLADELDEQYRRLLSFQLIASGVIHVCIIILLFLGMLPPQLVRLN